MPCEKVPKRYVLKTVVTIMKPTRIRRLATLRAASGASVESGDWAAGGLTLPRIKFGKSRNAHHVLAFPQLQ